jgi:hypothetical protein
MTNSLSASNHDGIFHKAKHEDHLIRVRERKKDMLSFIADKLQEQECSTKIIFYDFS